MNKRNIAINRFLFAIVAFVVVIVVPGLVVFPKQAGKELCSQKSQAKADIMRIGLALDLYDVDVGRYPSMLTALVTNSSTASGWRGPYLTNGVPKDPWGQEYFYQYLGQVEEKQFILVSLGPDRTRSKDDVE